VPVPSESVLREQKLFKPSLTLEEYLVEMLIEENHIKRYEDASITEISQSLTE
jgi:hypothetical protein